MFLGYQEEIIEGSEVPTLFISYIAETREELENMSCVRYNGTPAMFRFYYSEGENV